MKKDILTINELSQEGLSDILNLSAELKGKQKAGKTGVPIDWQNTGHDL